MRDIRFPGGGETDTSPTYISKTVLTRHITVPTDDLT